MFTGPVEVDETFIGGIRKNMSGSMHQELKDTGRGSVGKINIVDAKDLRQTGYQQRPLRAPWKGAFSWWGAKPTHQLSFRMQAAGAGQCAVERHVFLVGCKAHPSIVVSHASSRSGTWRVRHGLKHSGDKGLR